MKPEETRHYRELLLDMRKMLIEADRQSESSAAVVDLDQQLFGRLSRQDAMQQQEMAKATRERRAGTLRRVEEALVRLEREDFGECLECGEPIARARLDFDPSATLCIDCAEGCE